MTAPESAAASGSSQRIIAVDILRGLSALAIVIFHSRVHLWTGWRALRAEPGNFSTFDHLVSYLSIPAPFFGHAVMLFFILSGFCVHLPYAAGRRPMQFGSYMTRRLMRIYPPYLAAILLCLVVEFIMASWFNPEISSGTRFLRSLLMVQNYPPAPGQLLSNPSLWSLPVEVEMYLTYPLLLMLWRLKGITLPLLIVTVVSLVALLFYLKGMNWLTGNFTHYWVLWFSGALVAEWFVAGKIASWSGLKSLATAVLTIASLASVVQSWPTGIQHLTWGALFFMILWLCLSVPLPSGLPSGLLKALVGLGTISYSLYLVHYPLLMLAGGAIREVGVGDKPSNYLVSLIGSVLCILPAWLFYKFIEEPSHRIGKQLARPPSRREPVTVRGNS